MEQLEWHFITQQYHFSFTVCDCLSEWESVSCCLEQHTTRNVVTSDIQVVHQHSQIFYKHFRIYCTDNDHLVTHCLLCRNMRKKDKYMYKCIHKFVTGTFAHSHHSVLILNALKIPELCVIGGKSKLASFQSSHKLRW